MRSLKNVGIKERKMSWPRRLESSRKMGADLRLRLRESFAKSYRDLGRVLVRV